MALAKRIRANALKITFFSLPILTLILVIVFFALFLPDIISISEFYAWHQSVPCTLQSSHVIQSFENCVSAVRRNEPCFGIVHNALVAHNETSQVMVKAYMVNFLYSYRGPDLRVFNFYTENQATRIIQQYFFQPVAATCWRENGLALASMNDAQVQKIFIATNISISSWDSVNGIVIFGFVFLLVLLDLSAHFAFKKCKKVKKWIDR